MSDKVAYLGVGFLIGMIVMDQLWRYVWRLRERADTSGERG